MNTKFSLLPFRKKLLSSYFLLIILPLFAVMAVSCGEMVASGRQREMERIQSAYTQSLLSVDHYFNRYISLAQTLKADSYLSNYLNKRYPANVTVEKRYYDAFMVKQTYVTRLLYEKMSGNSITIYTSNQGIIPLDGIVEFLSDEMKESDWYQAASQDQNGCVLSRPLVKEGRKTIPLMLQLTPRSGFENLLRVDLLTSQFNELISSYDQSKDYAIADSSGNILAAKDGTATGSRLEEIGLGFLESELALCDQENRVLEKAGRVYVMGRICRSSVLSDCYLIESSISPSVTQPFMGSLLRSLPLWLALLLLDTVLILLFSRQFARRVSSLVSSVRRVAEGKAENIAILEGQDEFAVLSRYISDMILNVQRLLQDVYQAKLDAKSAQVHALQSQINPHFLFNCLQAIHTSALKAGALETSDMIVSYSRLIRQSITWDREIIPLFQELDLVRDYLKIQHMRFENRFAYELDVHSDCLNALIPKFTIQPIVENAIQHGMCENGQPCQVRVRIFRQEELLTIIVRDTGMGMDARRLETIRRGLEDDSFDGQNSHIGILNLQQRIRLQYGSHYGITLESVRAKGTTVTIHLPLRLTDEKPQAALALEKTTKA